MLDTKDFRNQKVTVYTANGNVAATYEGKIYIYYGDECCHFITEDNKHHRIFGNPTIVIDEV